MRRKIIQLAGTTLVVSLPSNWARINNVNKGDEIELTEQDSTIMLSLTKERTSDKKTIRIGKDEEYDPLMIGYLYQAGADEIRIEFENPDVFKSIQKKLPDLMGFEIIDQGEKFVEIKNVSSALEEEFETILRRTFYLLEEMGKACLESIEKNDYERLKDLINLENSIDKFTDFCKRVLNKRGYRDSRKTQFYYVIIRDLEKAGDFYENIIHEVLRYKDQGGIKLESELKELFLKANDFIKDFHRLFYSKDSKEAEHFLKQKKELKKEIKEILDQNFKYETIKYNLTGLIKIIGNMYGPYYATKI